MTITKNSINDPFSVASSHELMTLNNRDALLSDNDFLYLVEKGSHGWATLYAHYYGDLRKYISDTGEWYRRTESGYWEKDKKGVEKNDVGGVLKELLEERYKKISKSHGKKATKCIADLSKSLKTPKGIRDILYAADYAFGFDPNDWDSYEDGFIAVNNGIITKSGTLRQPELKDNAISYSDVDFTGISTPAPLWEKSLDEIFYNEPEKRDAFQRVMGYAASGDLTEKILPIFYGPMGNNGKSLITNIMGSILGKKLILNTSADKIMTQSFGAGRNAPDHFEYNLFGKKIVFAQEANKNVELDIGFVKRVTGKDRISARPSHAKTNIDFQPSHTMFLVVNDKPSVNGDDPAIWIRILPIKFNMTFVENPTSENEKKIDKYLEDKILDREKSGIIAWLLRGYLEYKKRGLDLPQCIIDDKASYYAEEDVIGNFIEQNTDTTEPEAKTSAKDLYTMFKTYCLVHDIDNKYNQKTFPKAIAKHGFERKYNGRDGNYFLGIRDVI